MSFDIFDDKLTNIKNNIVLIMKHFINQSKRSHAGRMNNGGGEVPKVRPVPIDVAHVVASAYTYGSADRLRQVCNVYSLSS